MKGIFASLATLTLLLLSYSPVQAAGAIFDDSAIKQVRYPAWFKQSFLDLDEDLAEAGDNGKLGLMMLFTTEGCSYCDFFIERSLGEAATASRVREHFDSIGLEIFDDAEMRSPGGESMPVKRFAKQSGAAFSPTLLFFDTDGNLLLKVVGYQSPERFNEILDYLIGGFYRTMSLKEFSRRNAATAKASSAQPLRSDDLFAMPPYLLDRSRIRAGRPLLVIFEAPGCEQCGPLHDVVLADRGIRELLGRFDVVRLDPTDERTPVIAVDGGRVNPKAWFDATGLSQLPALLFFDEAGNEVLRTDALILRQRMENSLNYVLDRAYEKDWTYQRYARSKSIERIRPGQR